MRTMRNLKRELLEELRTHLESTSMAGDLAMLLEVAGPMTGFWQEVDTETMRTEALAMPTEAAGLPTQKAEASLMSVQTGERIETARGCTMPTEAATPGVGRTTPTELASRALVAVVKNTGTGRDKPAAYLPVVIL